MKKIVIFIVILVQFIIFVSLIWLLNDLNINKLESFSEVCIEIEETDSNKIIVQDVDSFIKALKNPNIHIIELVNDLDLGYNLLNEECTSNNYILKHNEPLTHPILKQSGVTKLKILDKENLVIYSKNGSTLLHTNIVIENSKNIKLYNLKFEELWEWDEYSNFYYDRNDWDYITIKNSEKINIKNCEFSMSYDGIIDVKNSKNITIEYCKLNEMDINDSFFNLQFNELENNIEKYPMYKFLRLNVGLDIEKIKQLSSYQMKLVTIGTEDFCEKSENIIIHDSVFLNFKSRFPLARNSSVYLYNNYCEQHKINKDMLLKTERRIIEEKYPKFVSLETYGVISIQRGYVVVKNCFFKGALHKYSWTRGGKIENLGKIVKMKYDDNLENLKKEIEKNVGTIKINL